MDIATLRNFRIAWIILLVAPTAYSQSDEEILEVVRANATKIALEQASWTLPMPFHEIGLASSDKEKLIEQWANTSGACLADALATYAETTDVPLSEMVADDGSFGLKGDGSSCEFQDFLETCVERAWEAVGASHRSDSAINLTAPIAAQAAIGMDVFSRWTAILLSVRF